MDREAPGAVASCAKEETTTLVVKVSDTHPFTPGLPTGLPQASGSLSPTPRSARFLRTQIQMLVGQEGPRGWCPQDFGSASDPWPTLALTSQANGSDLRAGVPAGPGHRWPHHSPVPSSLAHCPRLRRRSGRWAWRPRRCWGARTQAEGGRSGSAPRPLGCPRGGRRGRWRPGSPSWRLRGPEQARRDAGGRLLRNQASWDATLRQASGSLLPPGHPPRWAVGVPLSGKEGTWQSRAPGLSATALALSGPCLRVA